MDPLFYSHLVEFATPEFDEAFKLRNEILCKPLNIEFTPDDIAAEYNSFHVGCYTFDDQELVGILILVPINTNNVKMRQVAVQSAWQGKGVGKFLVKESEKIAKANGFKKMEMNARDTAVPFYTGLGYTIEGTKFTEVGIDHYFMSKNLD